MIDKGLNKSFFMYTGPPSPSGNLDLSATSTTVTVTWTCPAVGSLMNLYYTVCHRKQPYSDNPTCTNITGNGCQNTYTVSGLLPFTAYEVTVTAHNHVSDQEPESLNDRTIKATIQTSEGGMSYFYINLAS